MIPGGLEFICSKLLHAFEKVREKANYFDIIISWINLVYAKFQGVFRLRGNSI